MDSVERLLQAKSFAVVGVSADDSKYGTRVFRDLLAKGFTVHGVNPRLPELDGQPIHPDLTSLPETPEAVCLVIPPEATEQVVREAHSLGIGLVWMQPGSESQAAIEYCEANGMHVVHSRCVMIHTNTSAN